MDQAGATQQSFQKPGIVHRLRNSYVLGLGIIALLLVTLEFINQDLLKTQERDAYLLNLAGRQRMLSQRICETVLLSREFPELGLSDELTSLLRQWTDAHKAIAEHIDTRESQEIYDRLTPSLNSVVGMASHAMERDEILTLVNQSDQFLENMEKLVARFEFEAFRRVETQKDWRIVILLVILGALILEARLIFQPLAGSLSRTLEKLGSANDEIRRALEEAEKAEHQKSQFLAHVSHEIRTPMNAICGLSSLALKRDVEPKLEDYLIKINSSAYSLLGILNDILDASKIEAGKVELEEAEFDLDALISHLAGILGTQAADVGLELFFAKEPDVPSILVGDSLRLSQVLINLVNNAIKFTPEGEVVVRIKLAELNETGALLEFSVTDTGIGMTPEQTGRLFQAFTQADVSTSRKYGGTGLGLVITKSLVELMGGTISLESEVGVGTCFRFSSRFGVSERSKESRFRPDENLVGLEILIVDNSETSREILTEMLESFSFTPVAVESGVSALEYLSNNSCDLVLMDWRMPSMDGMEAAKLIQERVETAPRILMVTAYGRESGQREARQLGLAGFLEKPLTSSALYDAIASAVGARTMRSLRPSREGVEYDFGGARVLVAEDNSINQQVAREFLESMNLSVEIAENGREALERLRSKEFAVVFMDIQMPEMNGYQATEQIRKEESLKDLPIVAMTAHALVQERERCLQAGMDAHLSKPINPEDVVKILGRWLEFEKRVLNPEPDLDLAPKFSEFDVKSGLVRAGNNPCLYRSLLKSFREKYHKAGEQLRAENLDLREKQMLAHALHGVAANLGGDSLAESAAAVELAAKENRCERFSQLLGELETRLSAAFQEVDLVLEHLGGDSEDGIGEEVLSKERVGKLIETLQEGDIEAISILESTSRRSFTPGQQEVFAKLFSLAEEFDFEGALVAARELEASLSARV